MRKKQIISFSIEKLKSDLINSCTQFHAELIVSYDFFGFGSKSNAVSKLLETWVQLQKLSGKEVLYSCLFLTLCACKPFYAEG